jgi:hypothetical protein
MNGTAMIEFGGELSIEKNQQSEQITLALCIPWLNNDCKIIDLYDKLRDSQNSKFIFNDSILNTLSLDGGVNTKGVVHEFLSRNRLCILPVTFDLLRKGLLLIKCDLFHYNQLLKSQSGDRNNIYIRFYIEPSLNMISTRKSGIGKSTIIYDIRINEKRNLPDDIIRHIRDYQLCKINSCFCFNIIPNSYDLAFVESPSLKSVRTLEFGEFRRYISDKRVKNDELIVVFNKKMNLENYSFFSIYVKERIGSGQFALAILINLFVGILLFIPSFRNQYPYSPFSQEFWRSLPGEVYLAAVLCFSIVLYFFGNSMLSWVSRIWRFIKKKMGITK